MKGLKRLVNKLAIRVFGDIQFFSRPFFLILWGDTHYKVKGPETRAIIESLKVGDVLLRRYDRYVSGWFIPGFWTHAAIMSSERCVAHATTHGVLYEDVFSFIRADYIAILRCADRQKAENAADLARSLIGKDYDFLFDAADDENFYCTELVKYCYPGTLDSLGCGCIPPDDLFKAGLEVIHDSRKYRDGLGVD